MRKHLPATTSPLQPFLPSHLPLGTLAVHTAAGTDGGAAAAAVKARRAARRADAGPSKRANKNRPTEAPVHVRPPRLRQIIQTAAHERRDPRFDPLVTGRDAAAAKVATRKRGAAVAAASDPATRRYAFLYDETLPAERDDIVAQLKKVKSPAARSALQARLTRISQALAGERDRRAAAARDKERRSTERAAVRAGKKPFYPKASALREAALATRFETLKSTGELDAHLAKRRRKNAAKDHRYVPSVRREG